MHPFHPSVICPWEGISPCWLDCSCGPGWDLEAPIEECCRNDQGIGGGGRWPCGAPPWTQPRGESSRAPGTGNCRSSQALSSRPFCLPTSTPGACLAAESKHRDPPWDRPPHRDRPRWAALLPASPPAEVKQCRAHRTARGSARPRGRLLSLLSAPRLGPLSASQTPPNKSICGKQEP